MSAGRPVPHGDGTPAEDRTGSSERPRVLVWFDYSCPFCYIDYFRFERLATEHDIEVVSVPFELRPSIPPEGISARDQGLEHSEHVAAYLARIAKEEGIELLERDLLPNTHLALLLGEVARDAGSAVHRAVHVGIFDALYGQGLDTGGGGVLLDVAETAGLPREAAEAAWTDARYEERLHAFRHLALSMGVDATPAALICNELLIGARPVAVLEAAISRCLVTLAEAQSAAVGT